MTLSSAAFPEVSVRRRADAVRLFETHERIIQILICKYARIMSPHGYEPLEVRQYVLIGIWRAALRYDPSQGSSFETYARIVVHGHIYDTFRELDEASRTLRNKEKKIKKVSERLHRKLMREPTRRELARGLKISVGDLRMWQQEIATSHRLNWVYLPVFSEDGTPYDFIPDEAATSPFDQVCYAERMRLLEEAISTLPEKSRNLIDLYYFKGLRHREIGRMYGVGEARSSGMVCDVLRQLRDILAPHRASLLNCD